MSTRRWTWLLVFGELVAMFGVMFCYSGAIMAGSFTVSNPERSAHWRFLATVYQLLTGVCLVAGVVILVVLFRRKRVTDSGAR